MAVQRLRSAARSTWVRGLVSLALLAVVLSRFGLGELRAALAGGNWEIFVMAVGVLLLALIIGGVRWHSLLAAAGVPTSLSAAQHSYFAGMFVSSFLPGAMAGDVARVLTVGGAGTRARATATLLVDRSTIFALAVVLGWAAVYVSSAPTSLILASGLTTVALVVGVLAATLSIWGAVWLRRYFPPSIRWAGRDGLVALRGLLKLRVVVGPIVGLAVAYEVLAVLSVWLLARSVGVDVSFWTIALITPPILVLSALPISIGGLGVREASYVGLLGEVGVSAPDATLIGLLAGASFLLATSPGAIALVRARSARTPRYEPDDGYESQDG